MTYDLDALERLCENLRRISSEFHTANLRARSFADAVGEAALEEAVCEFATNWDDNREEIAGIIDRMRLYTAALATEIYLMDYEATSVLVAGGGGGSQMR